MRRSAGRVPREYFGGVLPHFWCGKTPGSRPVYPLCNKINSVENGEKKWERLKMSVSFCYTIFRNSKSLCIYTRDKTTRISVNPNFLCVGRDATTYHAKQAITRLASQQEEGVFELT